MTDGGKEKGRLPGPASSDTDSRSGDGAGYFIVNGNNFGIDSGEHFSLPLLYYKVHIAYDEVEIR
jgi:hypothetical protein